MLIATFGPSTGWVGKTIVREGDAFVLEDQGVITASDVMSYDRDGHLVWPSEGTRAWVGALALSTSPQQGAEDSRTAAGGATLAVQATTLTKPADTRTDGQRAASVGGLFLLVVGILMVFYFAAAYDTSVAVDYSAAGGNQFGFPERVNNLGKMQTKETAIIIGLGMAIGGGVLTYIGRRRPAPVPAPGGASTTHLACTSCGNPVAAELPFCPHCGTRIARGAGPVGT